MSRVKDARDAWIEHVSRCWNCRRWPRDPGHCLVGVLLFADAAEAYERHLEAQAPRS